MRIVLKFGTGILTQQKRSGLDHGQLRRLAMEVAELRREGHECFIVSSGSVGAGMTVLGLSERPKDLPGIQACAAIGQSRLMRFYETNFSKQELHVAQVLLTHQDLDSRTRYQNAKNTLERLISYDNVVPIINENDTVAVEELRFGDNDKLSAEVATMLKADLLILLTSVPGVMTANGELLRDVASIEDARQHIREEVGKLSVGGMTTKLQAVQHAVSAGIETIVASGREVGLIGRLVRGEGTGTRFLVKSRKRKKG